MIYYLIRTESDPKVIGVKNGVTQVEILEEGYSDKDRFKKMINFFSYSSYWVKNSFSPEDNYQIEYARILKGALLTDFLMFSPSLMACPFMISSRVKEVFDQFNIQEHYYFSVKIFDSKKIVSDKYYLMYCPYLDYDLVDFSKSLFFTGSKLLGKKFYECKNRDEYLALLSEKPLLKSERIVFNDFFDKNLDFVNPRFGGLYVSERLKEAIKNENFSGIKILNPIEPILGE